MKDHLFIQLRELPYFRALVRAVEAGFYQTLDLPAPVLDIGCGDGHFAGSTFDRRVDVGIDLWHGPIHEARKVGAYHHLVEADGAAAPFPDGYFASAFSNSVLEHIPHVEGVLADVARVLMPGARFIFCVPNQRYFSELSLSRLLGKKYIEWFRRISRVHHADRPDAWQERLERTGFRLEQWWHYFPPAAMRVLEWGHYFGLPSLVAKRLTGRWIIAPTRWNLWLTERMIRRYATPEPVQDGTFTFYVARKA
ncbi:MAG: class I SAM-dependent methyltransferase [Chloroflexota bacterium]